MFKDQTQKINTCSKSTVETIKGEKICSKLAIKIVGAMTSFYSSVDKVS